MAINTLFGSYRGAMIAPADCQNEEGAPAYSLTPKQALAQYAATGCFGRTFYVSEQEQLGRVLQLCDGAGPGVCSEARHLFPPELLYEGHARAFVRVAVTSFGPAARSRVRRRDRQHEDAPKLRANPAVWRSRAQVSGNCSKEVSANLASGDG